jgi:RNA polymerase sigma factor (sigma-70 family)
MATTQLDTLLRHIRRLAVRGCSLRRTDRQLLEDFSANRDEAAFSTLVARHGPMVLRVCRRVLNHEQDAEDSFQATFLVLAQNTGSIRKPEALAEWLHGVAYRTAMEAKRKAARRRNHEARLRTLPPRKATNPTWDDVQAILDEEIQHLPAAFRAAFVLCALEGKSGPEAAAELGVQPGTVSSRLTRARQRLQQRLARRGIELSALLAALAVAENAGKAGVPALLASATVRSGLLVAAGGTAAGVIPAHVATLAAGVTRAMFLTKAKIATIVLTISLLAGSAGIFTHQALADKFLASQETSKPLGKSLRQLAAKQETDKPQKAPTQAAAQDVISIQGRVFDPDGKALAGGQLYLTPFYPKQSVAYPLRATTAADGRFAFQIARSEYAALSGEETWSFVQVIATAQGYGPDWAKFDPQAKSELTLRLVKDDVPLTGRVLDLQGRPVAAADIRLLALETTTDEDSRSYLTGWKAARTPGAVYAPSKELHHPSVVGLPRTVKTDADGRFRLIGCGRERTAKVAIEAPTIETHVVRIVPRPAAEIKTVVQDASERAMSEYSRNPLPTLYGIPFDHVAGPTKLIAGTVRDKETGEPVAGVYISGSPAEMGWLETANELMVKTDAQGHYKLAGLPKSKQYRLRAGPGEGSVYLSRAKLESGTGGLDPMTVDFEMLKGVEIHGRITDKATGKPVQASLRYAPLQGNTHPATDAFRHASVGYPVKRDGTFRLVVPPGPGALFAVVQRMNAENAYTQARLDPADKNKAYNADGPGAALIGLEGEHLSLYGTNAYRVINPPADGKSDTYDLQLDPGLSQTGTVLGPDGQPLPGILVDGLTPVASRPKTLETATFTVLALDAHAPRELLFLHKERKLGGHVTLRGDEKAAPTVKLEPLGTLRGRILDEDGQPRARVQVRLSYADKFFHRPVHWWGPRVEPITDTNGYFRIDSIIPGMELSLHAREKDKFLEFGGAQIWNLSLRPGEDMDLGDIKAKSALE